MFQMSDYSPSAFARPLSTPLKPINAIARRPAVTSAIAIPCMPRGIFDILKCSRIPAKMTRAKAKPKAVLIAYTTPVSRLGSSPWELYVPCATRIATPRIQQLVVIRGKKTPKA